MTVLYDYCELQERPEERLRCWKVCHLVLFGVVVISGLASYVCFYNTETFVGEGAHCLLSPRQLAFRLVPQTDAPNDTSTAQNVTKRDVANDTVTTVEVRNVTVFVANRTHRVMLDAGASLWGAGCAEAEYAPVLSSVAGLVWLAMFVMCPAGGASRDGLQQGWRVLAPALLSCAALAALTGHSFVVTNSGLQSFCAGFFNYTNSTACSAADAFLPSAHAAWSFGAHAAAARAAAAAAWAAWLCAAALLLARCLLAPDFAVRHTTVQYIDPEQTQKSPRQPLPSRRSARNMEVVSLRSEPTDSSLVVSDRPPDHERDRDRSDSVPELLEMTHSNPELKLSSHK